MSDHDASPKEWTHAHSLRHGSHKWLAKRLRIAAALTRLQQAAATAPAATASSATSSANNAADAATTIGQSSGLPPRMPSPFTFAPYAASTAPLHSHVSSDSVASSAAAAHRKRSSVEKILLIDANSTDATNPAALLPALSPHTSANDIEEGMEDESSSSGEEAEMDEEDETSDSAHFAKLYALTPQLHHSHLHGAAHPHSRFVHQTPPARFHAPLASHHQQYVSPLLAAQQQLSMYPTPTGLPPTSSHRSAAASPSPSPPPGLAAAAAAASAASRPMLVRSYSDIDFNAAAQLDTMHAYALQQQIHLIHHAPLMNPPVDWSKCRLCLNQLLQTIMPQQDILNSSTQSAYSPVHLQQYRVPSPFTTPAMQSHSLASSLRATPVSVPAATLEAVSNSLRPSLPPPNMSAELFPPAASLSASPLVPIPSQPNSGVDVSSVSPAATSVSASASPSAIGISASAPPPSVAVATLPPVASVPPLITLSRNFLILLSILKETDGRDKIAKVVQYGGRTLRILLHKIPSFTWWSMFLWRQFTTGKISRVFLALKVLIWENRGQTVKNLGELTKKLLEISPPSAVAVAASAAGAAAAAVKAVDPAHPGLHATSMASALVASYTADTSALSESLYRLPFYSGVISRLDVLTAALSSARRIIRVCKWTYTLPGWVKTFEEWRKQVQAGIEKEMEKKMMQQQAEMEMEQQKEEKEKEEQLNKNTSSTTLETTTTITTTTVEKVPSQPKSAPFRFSHPHPTHVWRRLPWLSSVELLDLSIAVMTDVSDDFEWLSKYKLFPDELGYKCGRIAMILWFTTVVLDLALTFRILRHYIYQRGEIQRQIAETETEYDSSRFELARLQHKREEKTYRRLVRELKRTSAERFSGGRYEPTTPANAIQMANSGATAIPNDVAGSTPPDLAADAASNASSWSVVSGSSAADSNDTSREVRSNSDSSTIVISSGSSSTAGDHKGHSSGEDTSPVDISQSTPTKTATDSSLSSSICIVPSASTSSSSSSTAAASITSSSTVADAASSKPITPASPATKQAVAPSSSSSKKLKKAREKKKSKQKSAHTARKDKHDSATVDADDGDDDDGEEEDRCLTSEVAAAQVCGKVSHESHAVADCQKQAAEEAKLMLREREFSQRHLDLNPSSSSQQQADQAHVEAATSALIRSDEAAVEDDSGIESDEDTISLVHARTVESLHRLSDLHSQQSATRVSLFLQYLNFAKFAADLGCALPMALNVHKEWDGLVQSTGLVSGLLGIYKLFITTKPAQ